MTQFIRISTGLIVALGFVLATQLTMLASAQAASRPNSVADLAEGLLDAVVNISTSQVVKQRRGDRFGPNGDNFPFREFFDDLFPRGERNQGEGQQPQQRSQRRQSLGSGFVIDPSGTIITNNHVIDGADEIVVNFNDKSKLKAKVIGRDPKTDLAVLKVEADGPLKSVKLGDSKKLRVGDWVMAIGNPFGFGGSVSLGIVSARNRNINAGPYDQFIQTDAAINRGNSGGPLFNMDGEVVGINTAIISPSGGSNGIGFSVPTELAAGVIAQLREFGETRRGWLGVQIQPVDEDVADSLGLAEPSGALVAVVTKGGPAEKAGIKSGDVIIAFDGKLVPQMTDLPRMVAAAPVGKSVDVKILRNRKTKNVKVVLGRLEDGEKLIDSQKGGQREQEEEAAKETEILGLTLSPLNPATRGRFKLPDDMEGVAIVKVDPSSAAAEKRIQPGDVIVEVGQEPVRSPGDVTKQVEALKNEGRKTALLLLSNGQGRLRFVGVRIEDKE